MKQLYYETLHSGLVKVEPVRYEPANPALFLEERYVVRVVGDHDKRPSDGGYYRDGEEIWCVPNNLVHKAKPRGIYQYVRQADVNAIDWGEEK